MKTNLPKSSQSASHNRGDLVSIHDSQKPRMIKLGVDTHGGQYTFCRMVDQLGIQPAQKLSPEDFLTYLRKQVALADEVVMVYEAGPYGFALARDASALGVRCLVCAPERMSRGRKVVNDKIDARELTSRLDRYVSGNQSALRLVMVPTLQQELNRRLGRERNTYRKEHQRWKARGRSLLHIMGVSRPGRWWEPLRMEPLLQQIQDRHGKPAMEQVRAELERHRETMQSMGRQLKELTDQLQGNAAAKRRANAQGKQVPANSSTAAVDEASGKKSSGKKPVKEKSPPRIKGIGDLSEELLDLEVGDWQRFTNRRQIASYTGLCPGEDSSGDRQMKLSIDKHGNPRVRAVLVELAWLMPRYQPEYLRVKRWKSGLESSSAARRKKAAVALARQLAVDLWRIKTGKVTPEKLGLKMTG